MTLDKKTIKNIILIVLIIAVIWTVFQNLNILLVYIFMLFKIIFPFILGGAIAFLLNIPMVFFERLLFKNKKAVNNNLCKKISRPCSLVLSMAAIAAVVTGVFTVVVPQLTDTIKELGITVYRFLPRAETWILNIINNDYFKKQIMGFFSQFDWKSITNYLGSFFRSGTDMLSSTLGVVTNIFSTTVNVVIAFIFSIYVLLQKEKLSVQCKKLVLCLFTEEKSKKIFYVFTLINKTFNKFVTGQCLEAIILGTLFFIVMSIIRLPYALLVGVVIGFTALIPLVGAFIGCFISAFLILMVSPVKAIIFIAVFLILQQIEGNLIYPHVVGNSVGLPSIWVLVAVTIGGSLFGIVGMLVFIPISSVVYSLLRDWTRNRINNKKINVDNYI